ncbi:unnamed protein product [Closterium sp. Yama58-4]|nr:unnamed protein product [Closterium sp. Yama58-4]
MPTRSLTRPPPTLSLYAGSPPTVAPTCGPPKTSRSWNQVSWRPATSSSPSLVTLTRWSHITSHHDTELNLVLAPPCCAVRVSAFKALARMIVVVGKQLLQHCDTYVHSRNPQVPPGKLQRVVEQSPCHKARLLLYLPPQLPPPTPLAAQEAREGEGVEESPAENSRTSQEEEAVACARNGGDGGASASESLTAVADADVSSWCGWHLDHGSLTGLTRAQFWRGGEAMEGSELDPTCGLYIRTRDGQIVQAHIPEGCIAFQVGHAMSIQSGGLLAATPHCVAAPKGPASVGISRATLAVFMQVRTVHVCPHLSCICNA